MGNRVTPNRRPHLAERLPKIDPREIEQPTGRYCLEFFDDLTGRRVHREFSDNYISPNWERVVLGSQYVNPYINGPVAHNSTVYSRLSGMYQDLLSGRYQDRMWTPFGNVSLPMDSVILTNDDTPENTTDTWLRGLVIAFATRWKATVAASGARGLINEAECAFSNGDNTHKTVWDWTTQQGNGTFQCLGLGSAIEYRDPAVSNSAHLSPGDRVWCGLGPSTVYLDDSIPLRLGTSGGTAWSNMMSNPAFDGSNMFFIVPGSHTGADNFDLFSLPEASVMAAATMTNDGFVQDARGLTPTLICDTGVGHVGSGAATTTQVSLASAVGLCKVGSEFVMAYSVSNALRLRRFTSTGSQVWQQNTLVSLSSEGRVAGVVYDGSTHLYVLCSGGGANASIYRCNPATGAITATIPIPSSLISASGVTAMATASSSSYVKHPVGIAIHPDGDLLFCTGRGIVKMTPDGVASSPYSYGLAGLTLPNFNEAGASPWSTQGNWNYHALYSGRSSLGWADYTFGAPRWGDIGGSGTDDDSNGPRVYGVAGRGRMMKENEWTPSGMLGSIFVYNNKLWCTASRFFTGGWSSQATGVMFLGIQGNNFFSKTTLDTPRTKTSSQNMKVSYELTWPSGNVADRAPHPDLV